VNPNILLQLAMGTQTGRRQLQAKLKVNTPGDTYEQEADRIADQVMGTPTQHTLSDAPPYVQRLSGQSNGEMEAAPASVDHVLASPGRPLEPELRQDMEQRLGRDFSRVRVHSSAAAEQSAQDVNANAYTVGHDIVFGAGRFSPGIHDGQRLLAHELTHVVQQARGGLSLQREPQQPKPDARAGAKAPKASPKGLAPEPGQWVSADYVQEIKRDNETWMMTINGFTDPADVQRLIFPHRLPKGVTIIQNDKHANVIDPFVRGWFVLHGITFDALWDMEYSIARLFIDRGLVDETKESVEIKNARAAFRARHDGHPLEVLVNIDLALNRVTKHNPNLLLAYYRYYAKNELTDELPRTFKENEHTGATLGGDTDINPRVLNRDSVFPTRNSFSLLGGTLIHEFSHTSQDNPLNDLYEAKAYGIEYFLTERTGDDIRGEVLRKRYSKENREIKKMFYQTSYAMQILYEMIDNGGPAAEEARNMSVEFISKNADDYRPKLQSIVLEASTWYVP
jgi:hypothetical protein